MTAWIVDGPDGAIVRVRVIPRAGRSRLDGTRGQALLVRVVAAPADGAANDELLSVLSAALDVPRRALTIVAGQSSRDKRIRIDSVPAAEVMSRLAQAMTATLIS